MGAGDVVAFLSSLAVRAHVSASTQNQALNALVFLYRNVLRIELSDVEGMARARQPVQPGQNRPHLAPLEHEDRKSVV